MVFWSIIQKSKECEGGYLTKGSRKVDYISTVEGKKGK
jgi:hypothetical protein